MYVPILKWRQGEYLALGQLHPNVKDKVIPLIEIPPIEWDFEQKKEAKTIDEHLKPFANRLVKKWKYRTGDEYVPTHGRVQTKNYQACHAWPLRLQSATRQDAL